MIVIADDYAFAELGLRPTLVGWREQFIPMALFWVDQLPKVEGLGTTADREAKTRVPVRFIIAPVACLDSVDPQRRRNNKSTHELHFPAAPATRALEAQCTGLFPAVGLGGVGIGLQKGFLC